MEAPKIPRESWATHPNYPSQILLLGSHENFRMVQRMVEQKVADPSRPLADAAYLFERWMAAMSNHEAYEERKLYPFLVHRWNVDLGHLVAGHEALAARKNTVREAFRAEDRELSLAAVKEFGSTLFTHLELEEDAVIPLLLSLSPSEFRRYYDS
ncbi:MAG: hemerythrin domain-containing protein [Myxococcota bacterium]